MPAKIDAVSSGASTANSGTFWVHASDSSAVNQAATLRLEISTNKNFSSPISSQSITTKPEDGLTAKLSDFKLEITPLKRFYNSNSGDHVWTNDQAEIDKITGASALKSGYVEETYDKITLWNQSAALAANNNDFSKLYRLYNGAKSDHLYTSSLVEKDNATKNLGYVDEGAIGAACLVKASADAMGLSGIARFLNNTTNQHHFVLDQSPEFTALAGNASFKNEGIVCWL